MGQMGENRLLNGMGQERYESQVGPDRVWKIFEQAVMKRVEAQISSDKLLKSFGTETYKSQDGADGPK